MKNRMTEHHRLQKSRGGQRTKENISFVSDVKHRAFHTLFADWTPWQIANELTNVWIDPRYELVVRRKSTGNKFFEQGEN